MASSNQPAIPSVPPGLANYHYQFLQAVKQRLESIGTPATVSTTTSNTIISPPTYEGLVIDDIGTDLTLVGGTLAFSGIPTEYEGSLLDSWTSANFGDGIGASVSNGTLYLSLDQTDLSVHGYTTLGGTLSFSAVDDISFQGNAYLSTQTTVSQYGIVNSDQYQSTVFDSLAAGGGWLYFEFLSPTLNQPPATPLGAPLQSAANCYMYFSRTTEFVAGPLTLIAGDELDNVGQVFTSPATLATDFAGTIAAGATLSTISVPVQPGRFYIAIVDDGQWLDLTAASTVEFDTSIASTLISAGSQVTGVLLGADVNISGQLEITISNATPFIEPGYLGGVLVPTVDDPNHVTVTVPPLTLFEGGALVSGNLHTLVSGVGIKATGSQNSGTIDSFICIEQSGTLLDAQSTTLNFSGHGVSLASDGAGCDTIEIAGLNIITEEDTLIGMLGFVAGSNIELVGTSGGYGTIVSTATTGITYEGSLYPTFAPGSNITLAPGTGSLTNVLIISSSGSSSGGGDSFASVEILTDGLTLGAFSTIDIAPNLIVGVGSVRPTPVQSASGTNGTAQLNFVPAVGNYVLLVYVGSPQTQPAGFVSLAEYDILGGLNYLNIYGKQIVSGDGNPAFPAAGSGANSWVLVELENFGSVLGSSFGPPSPNTGSISWGCSTFASTSGCVIWASFDTSSSDAGLYPSGTTLLHQVAFGSYTTSVFYTPIESVGAASVGYSSGGTNYGLAEVSIQGVTTGDIATLSSSLPLVLNGTTEAQGVQELVIQTGAAATSVTFSSGTLVLNLGTP
jgi:hypothetical protein